MDKLHIFRIVGLLVIVGFAVAVGVQKLVFDDNETAEMVMVRAPATELVEALSQEVVSAKEAGQVPLVLVVRNDEVSDWFLVAARRPPLSTALEPVRLLQVSEPIWTEAQPVLGGGQGIATPFLYEVDDAGKATGRFVSRWDWHDQRPATMARVVDTFLARGAPYHEVNDCLFRMDRAQDSIRRQAWDSAFDDLWWCHEHHWPSQRTSIPWLANLGYVKPSSLERLRERRAELIARLTGADPWMSHAVELYLINKALHVPERTLVTLDQVAANPQTGQFYRKNIAPVLGDLLLEHGRYDHLWLSLENARELLELERTAQVVSPLGYFPHLGHTLQSFEAAVALHADLDALALAAELLAVEPTAELADDLQTRAIAANGHRLFGALDELASGALPASERADIAGRTIADKEHTMEILERVFFVPPPRNPIPAEGALAELQGMTECEPDTTRQWDITWAYVTSWCEKADGTKHGSWIRWAKTGFKDWERSFVNGETVREVHYRDDGTVRPPTKAN